MGKKIFAILDSCELYGKELSNLQVYKILKENKFEVIVAYNKFASNNIFNEISAYKNYAISYPRQIAKSVNFRSIKYITYFFNANYRLIQLLSKEKPDFLLIPTEIALSYLLPTILIHKKIKIVFRIGDAPILYRKKNSRIACMIYGQLWKRIVLPRLNCTVSISKFIQEKLIESGRKKNYYDKIIYNLSPDRNIVNKLNITSVSPSSLKLGYMGRIVYEKGIHLLIEAVISLLNEAINIELFIAGNEKQNTEYCKQINKIVTESKYKDKIHFIGIINDIDTFYKAIDISCAPSIYEEPLGNILVEAKKFSKPSIIFNVGGMPELISHKENGYICHSISMESLKEAILYYYNNKNRIIIEGKKAYSSIKELGIDEEEYKNKWISVFNQL